MGFFVLGSDIRVRTTPSAIEAIKKASRRPMYFTISIAQRLRSCLSFNAYSPASRASASYFDFSASDRS